MAMRSSTAGQSNRFIRLAIAAAVSLLPVHGAGAAECSITAAVPDDLLGKTAPALHAAPHVRPPAQPQTQRIRATPHTSTHGQIVLGRDAPRVLYHLPIFMADPWEHPHNFQVVLTVAPVDVNDEATRRYVDERAQHPESLYTAVPPIFDQIALVYDYPGGEPLRHLEGVALFRNHFEQPAAQLITDAADLVIERVVHFQEFDPTREPAATLAYLLFNAGDEHYMVHLLSGPPDFDQLLEVVIDGDALSDERLRDGVVVTFDVRKNEAGERLVAGEALTCPVSAELAGSDGQVADLTLRVVADIYCEVGELAHTVGSVVGTGFGRPQACPS